MTNKHKQKHNVRFKDWLLYSELFTGYNINKLKLNLFDQQYLTINKTKDQFFYQEPSTKTI